MQTDCFLDLSRLNSCSTAKRRSDSVPAIASKVRKEFNTQLSRVENVSISKIEKLAKSLEQICQDILYINRLRYDEWIEYIGNLKTIRDEAVKFIDVHFNDLETKIADLKSEIKSCSIERIYQGINELENCIEDKRIQTKEQANTLNNKWKVYGIDKDLILNILDEL